MVPQFLFDLTGIDLNSVQFGVEEIEKINPHRGAMRMIDAITFMSPEMDRAIARKDVRGDEFWVPGHIPGRPIFPGVLMIEAAAQLASFVTLKRLGDVPFMGFAGVDEVKFRGQVVPGDSLYVLGSLVEFRRRRSVCKGQGIVRGTMVFEVTITGMPM
ncbi:MAG: beta-hydroxyacyl-ACP dehydratase [Planctomycetes bacterium]|nr:beta-hydroxyacyl-ACP dehydratase [Planctomycetota bacterium]